MTKSAWLTRVKDNLEDLRFLVDNYHPGSVPRSHPYMTITAPNAEKACAAARQQIAHAESDQTQSPVLRFQTAVEKQDVWALYRLLEQSWFGVPESRSCWGIRGFAEAVDLMDDPPENEEE